MNVDRQSNIKYREILEKEGTYTDEASEHNNTMNERRARNALRDPVRMKGI